MQITLIRHLPTDWNKSELMQGRKDIPISAVTEHGMKGISDNQAKLMKFMPFDLVLASTLQRTHQTAHLHGFTPHTEPLLDELNFGPFEGVAKKKLYDYYGKQWFEHPSGIVLGESIENLGNRVVSFIQKYYRMNNLLVFGHGCWIRALLSYYHFGHLNHMNKLKYKNNECRTLQL